ncbi:MAG TPA: hypothetical protein VFM54_00565 [Micromonosporaceae bacterium]|nr:hypothetical protein [Micromonosporaceae bacterium]
MPGDAEAVRRVARRFECVADDTELVRSRLATVAEPSCGTDALWIGEAADLFHEQLRDLVPDLEKLSASHATAREALVTYAAELESAQDIARRALAAADEAIGAQHQAGADHDYAEGERRVYAAQAAAASSSLRDIRLSLLALAVVPDPARVAQLHAEEHRQQVARDVAVNQVHEAAERCERAVRAANRARANLDAARQLAQDAALLREQAGRTASRRLHEASEAGIHNKPWLAQAFEATVDVVTHVVRSEFYQDFMEALAEVGGVLCAAGTLISLVAPGVGALLVLLGTAMVGGAFVMRLLSFAVGATSGKDLFWSGVDLLSARAGLGRALKLARGPHGTEPLGGYHALGGAVKRSLAWENNSTLAGPWRKLLWTRFTVADKEIHPRLFFLSPKWAQRADTVQQLIGVGGSAGTILCTVQEHIGR